ncbi:MAG: WG repeat-containing protein [Planctomycetes bacterium]|nr:WG repeat-containing protein [Planctomycetota bacterium]
MRYKKAVIFAAFIAVLQFAPIGMAGEEIVIPTILRNTEELAQLFIKYSGKMDGVVYRQSWEENENGELVGQSYALVEYPPHVKTYVPDFPSLPSAAPDVMPPWKSADSVAAAGREHEPAAASEPVYTPAPDQAASVTVAKQAVSIKPVPATPTLTLDSASMWTGQGLPAKSFVPSVGQNSPPAQLFTPSAISAAPVGQPLATGAPSGAKNYGYPAFSDAVESEEVRSQLDVLYGRNGVRQDVSRAAKELASLAANDASAVFYRGAVIDYGMIDGSMKDYAEAYTEAAMAGDARAMFERETLQLFRSPGELRSLGYPVRNEEEIRDVFRRIMPKIRQLADAGDPWALYQWARYHHDPRMGYVSDKNERVDEYEYLLYTAAGRGNPAAMYILYHDMRNWYMDKAGGFLQPLMWYQRLRSINAPFPERDSEMERESRYYPDRHQFAYVDQYEETPYTELQSKWLTMVRASNGAGYVDDDGRIVVPFGEGWAGNFDRKGLAPRLVRMNYGFANSEGRLVIAPCFNLVRQFSDSGLAAVQMGKKWGYINLHGNIVIPFVYDQAGNFDHRGLAYVVENGSGKTINTEGAVVNPADYDYSDDASPYSLSTFRQADKVGYRNSRGDWKINPIYSYAEDFTANGTAVVDERKVIDMEGNVLIDSPTMIPEGYSGAGLIFAYGKSAMYEDREEKEPDMLIDDRGEVRFLIDSESRTNPGESSYTIRAIIYRPDGEVVWSNISQTDLAAFRSDWYAELAKERAQAREMNKAFEGMVDFSNTGKLMMQVPALLQAFQSGRDAGLSTEDIIANARAESEAASAQYEQQQKEGVFSRIARGGTFTHEDMYNPSAATILESWGIVIGVGVAVVDTMSSRPPRQDICLSCGDEFTSYPEDFGFMYANYCSSNCRAIGARNNDLRRIQDTDEAIGKTVRMIEDTQNNLIMSESNRARALEKYHKQLVELGKKHEEAVGEYKAVYGGR